MESHFKSTIATVFSVFPEIKLAYFFGSRAENKAGPLSDYDFAVYLDSADLHRSTEIKIDLIARLSLSLKTDQVDVVLLNSQTPPELAYQAICGQLIYAIEPYQLLVEPKILNHYFDFKLTLQKNHLTQAK